MGRITAVCSSEKKGTVKTDRQEGLLIQDYGLQGDAHAGSPRQVSLLSAQRVQAFAQRTGLTLLPGAFGENLLIEELDFAQLQPGVLLRCGEALLEITQIGKSCHKDCAIRAQTGDCIMPQEGVFARVRSGGRIRTGDSVQICGGSCHAAILTASDRAYGGIYTDESTPLLRDILTQNGCQVVHTELVPDDEQQIYQSIVRIADELQPDILFTTGGTGFAMRDRVPEATLAAAERMAPGIAEALRACSMKITPRAMLSRGQSVLRGRTLIINLPGSPKAVKECVEFLFPTLLHGIQILRGEGE